MKLRIKEAIKENGLTQTKVAERMGKSKQTLSTYIKNGNPSIQTLSEIAKAVGVPISHLYEGDGGQEELTALIYHKGNHYKASTIAELEEVVSKIKERE